MFQYAFGYALSKKYADEVCFEAGYFNEQCSGVGKRKVVLDNYFNLSSFELIDRPKEVIFYENRYINRIIRTMLSGKQLICNEDFLFYKEPYRKFQDKIPYFINKNNYYDGYWLTSRYFSDFRDDLLREFRLSGEYAVVVNEKMNEAYHTESVAIHIRRGDYLNKFKSNIPDGYDEKRLNEYYYRAINYMLKALESPVFYVFSDDIEWCRENLKMVGAEIRFVQNVGSRADLLDLFCISKCKHGIMSPSTFSWWGNWLRVDNADSIVVLPEGSYANNYFAEENWIFM